jgi:hypothetical protein
VTLPEAFGWARGVNSVAPRVRPREEGSVKALHRTLAILASLFLVVQTIRHAYVLWLEPRTSVLDKFDQPLKDEIAAATSVEELVRRYEPMRKEADRIKAERRAADPKAHFEDEREVEPFRSEATLRQAISSWEQRAKEMFSLRFYWLVGFTLSALGVAAYRREHRWLGTTLLIIGFSEIIYWTTPTFFSGGIQEFDRLVENKLALSLASVVVLGLTLRLLNVFEEDRRTP